MNLSRCFRAACFFLLSFGFVATASAQQSAAFTKYRHVFQISPTTFVPYPLGSGEGPFIAEAYVSATSNTSQVFRLTPPGQSARTLVLDREFWEFDEPFGDRPALDAAFPNGTYTWSLNGTNVAASLTGDIYPDTPPLTPVAGGATWQNNYLVVDTTRTVELSATVSTNYLAGSTTVIITFITASGQLVQGSNTTTSPTASVTLPVNSLRVGQDSFAIVTTIRTVTRETVPGYLVSMRYGTRSFVPLRAAGTTSSGITFTRHPGNLTIAEGSGAVFQAQVTGATSYQWLRNDTAIAGATSDKLILTPSTALAGTYVLRASNPNTTASSTAATLTVTSTTNPGRLVNLAIRTSAGAGSETLIVGFSVGGASGAKPLLLRAVGPTLANFGVADTLADPVATVFRGSTSLATNDDWAGNGEITTRASAVSAFELPSTSRDAAFALSPDAGAYTMQITGKQGATGVALAEIYDASPSYTSTTPRLVNVSARARVGTGGNILIAGFVVGGSTAKTVLLRAVGPTLTPLGVSGALADPVLKLYSGTTLVLENDDWGGDPQVAAVAGSVNAFGLSGATSADSVLLVTLPAGSYTAQVSGYQNSTGVALVELYEVP